MSQIETQRFISYWQSLVPQGQVPRPEHGYMSDDGLSALSYKTPLRKDYDPLSLKDMVPDMFMITTWRDDYRLRLNGANITHWHNAELQAFIFSDLFEPHSQAGVRSALSLSEVREKPVILSLRAKLETYDYIQLSIVLAPLCNRNQLTDRFIGFYNVDDEAYKVTKLSKQPFKLLNTRLIEGEITPMSERHKPKLNQPQLRLITLNGQRLA